jgi:hypothetical protein
VIASPGILVPICDDNMISAKVVIRSNIVD